MMAQLMWAKRLTCGVRVKGGVKLFQYTTVVCFLSAHLCKPRCKQSSYFGLSGLGHSKSWHLRRRHSWMVMMKFVSKHCLYCIDLASFDLCVGKIMWLLSVCAVKLFMKNHSRSIRDALCRDGVGVQYMQYLNKSLIIRVSCLMLEISVVRQ